MVIFESVLNGKFNTDPNSVFGGVKVKEVTTASGPAIEIFNPSHPHADLNGIVKKPNVSPLEEMVDMITATRAYEANLSIMKQSKKMAEAMINVGK